MSDEHNRKIKRSPYQPQQHPPNQQRNGGGKRDRTDDLLLAKQALSQLSYTPELINSITR